MDLNVKAPTKRTKRGQYLYDLVKEPKYKVTLDNVKEFLSKYYQSLSYQEIIRITKSLYNVNLTTNDIKNLALGLNMKPKNLDSSTRKYTKKQFNFRVSRGLWLTYYDYNTLEELRMKPK